MALTGTKYSFKKHLKKFKQLSESERLAIVDDQARKNAEAEASAKNPKRYMSLAEWNQRKYGTR